MIAKYTVEANPATSFSSSSRTPYEPMPIAGASLLHVDPRDGLIRARLKKNVTSSLFKAFPPSSPEGRITRLVSDASTDALWVGFDSGRITVINYQFDPQNLTLKRDPQTLPVNLFAHDAEVTTIEVCPEFGIAVSASSADGRACVWDLQKPQFIRSLEFERRAILCERISVAVSKTSGDIAIVRSGKGFSTVSLFNINGMLIAEERDVEPEVTAVTFSGCPEGVSVNCLVTGHSNGNIRYWSSWDLTPVGELTTLPSKLPISALAFNFTNHMLFAATKAEVIAFEKSNPAGLNNKPNFVSLTKLPERNASS